MSTPSEHIVGATCPHCGHPNYYDARELCKGAVRYRGAAPAAARDEIAVTCQKCGKAFKIAVDCEAHR